MHKICRIVKIILLLQWALCASSNANEEVQVDKNTSGQIYFKPYSADGVPVPPLCCERNNTNKIWMARDLGQGVNVVVGVKHEEGMPISVTLLFLYYDGKLEISPNEFELHGFPGEKVFSPSEVHRKVYEPSNSNDTRYGEWIYLKFPAQPETVEQLALVFPSDTVSKRGNINIRPFRFEKTNGTTGSNSLEISRPIIITLPLPVGDRMKSCDPKVAIAAAEEVIRKQATLKDPLSLFTAAATLFQHSKKDEAVFWFYAAQLRTRYQLVFENGDRGQLLAIMLMTVGAPINNYAFQNVENLRRILDRALEWDKTAPNSFRERPHSEAEEQKIAAIYAGMHDLQVKIVAEQADLEAKARKAAPEIESMYAAKNNPQCRAGQVDPSNAAKETAKEKILVSDYVLNNPEVVQDAGEIKNTWVETFSTKSTDTMPSRYEVGVISSVGKESHAIVDVSRSGSDVKFKLLCIAHKRWVLRDPTKDPCNQ